MLSTNTNQPPDRLSDSIPLANRTLTVMQSADPFVYYEMIEKTSRTAREFCRRSYAQYELFLGIKRGFWSWHATYNRINMFSELNDRNYKGWILYLDADAYIVDLDFDINEYLKKNADFAAILTHSGASSGLWDVNDGVMFLNLGHPLGQQILREWKIGFAALTDDFLLAHHVPFSCAGSQSLLHDLLRRNSNVVERIKIETADFMNSSHATFIRQTLRSQNTDFAARVTAIGEAVDRVTMRQTWGEKNVNHQIVDAAYHAILGRSADQSGLKSYLITLETKGRERGIAELIVSLLDSNEYLVRKTRSI